ncbi:hypothetical protein GPALN_012603 [Globodera pallida]|nr:hypothetical protein GPALN_012603 [Globodera pallida]
MAHNLLLKPPPPMAFPFRHFHRRLPPLFPPRIGCFLLPLLLLNLAGEAWAGTNCSAADATRNCVDGMAVPIWKPFLDLSIGDRVLRGLIYFFLIAYLFLGVSIVADRFMSSIEVITSMERTVVVKRLGLPPTKVKVRIWNDTVSNLSLMALGSSAPEILLSIIEVIGKGFEAGDLGPNTIVGSAAFNLFMIIAICVSAVPPTEIRRQKHLDVFFVTATWSVFAYIWMYLILAFFSPGVIEIWEGLVTFAFFPLTVLTAWIADIKFVQKKFVPHRYRRGSHGMIATEGEELKMLEGTNGTTPAGDGSFRLWGDQESPDPALKAFEEHRREFIETMRDAEYEMITKGPKSRAFYRVQATRRLVGGGDIVRKRLEREHDKSSDVLMQQQEQQARQHTCRLFFDPAHYTVLESVGMFDVMVGRDGGPDGLTVMVDYYTEDGTANAGSDYQPKISIEIVDDDVFEEDEHFYLHLTNLRVRTRDGLILDPSRIGGVPVALLDLPTTATIMILDDDHAGVFSFEHDHYQIVENCGHVTLRVQRTSGCRGQVMLPYKTFDGTATGGKHFEVKEGEALFENNQTEAFVDIGIVDTEQYERSDFFYVEVQPPIWTKKMSDLSKVQERFQRRLERKRLSLTTAEETRRGSVTSSLAGGGDGEEGGQRESGDIGHVPSVPSTPNFLRAEPAEHPQTPRDGRRFFRNRLNTWFGQRGADDNPFNLTPDQLEIAELGKPRLGEFRKCQITIKESKEFQASC